MTLQNFRKILIGLGFLVPATKLLWYALWLFNTLVMFPGIGTFFDHFLARTLGLAEPFAIGALCLFAAHWIKPIFIDTNTDPSVFGAGS